MPAEEEAPQGYFSSRKRRLVNGMTPQGFTKPKQTRQTEPANWQLKASWASPGKACVDGLSAGCTQGHVGHVGHVHPHSTQQACF